MLVHDNIDTPFIENVMICAHAKALFWFDQNGPLFTIITRKHMFFANMVLIEMQSVCLD